jgi:hypothetical protein
MNVESSFTLCPSRSSISSAASSESEGSADCCACDKSTIKSTNSPDDESLQKPHLIEQRMLPGTLMEDMPSSRVSSCTIKAAPFERLVHHRNLPKGEGTISSLKIKEYLAAAADENPPLFEIQIPLSTAVEQGLVELSNDDWKDLYSTCQRDLTKSHEHSCKILNENRYLKRQLIELQKRLNESRRNKRRSESPWQVPEPPRHKRIKTETVARAVSRDDTSLAVSQEQDDVDTSSSS